MRIHRYGGKESGLMMIGSASELRQLGAALLAIPDDALDLSAKHWPQQVAEIRIDARREYKVSFHLDTALQDIPTTNFPRLGPFG